MAREVYVSAPPASSVTVTIGQRAQMEGDRRTYTRSHAGPRRPLRTLRPETKGQGGACPDRTRAIPCTVRAATGQSMRKGTISNQTSRALND